MNNSSQRKKILEMVNNNQILMDEGVQLLKGLIPMRPGNSPTEDLFISKRTPDLLSSGHESGEIAVIGMAGRFPGARSVEDFWRNLKSGKNSVTDIPLDRWEWDLAKDKLNCKWGAFLPEIDRFDPFFFNLSAREAEMMDPRQRLFLQEAWKALEDAGYSDRDLEETECGVFVGCQEGDYLKTYQGEINPYLPTGISNSILAARIAYFLNLKGPSMAIDTACSSALVAVHLACESIRGGTCAMAIAGGVLVMSTPAMLISLDKLGMFSPKGQCRVFDNEADGTVAGEAVGVVVLKRLDAALRDGDQIYGVIKGSEINQDGKTSGITAPSASSQTALERKVYQKYHLHPETISYVETHGTGTKLGDPIEIQALTDAFRSFTAKKNYCAIGSVKTNIGHSMPAAAISSLIKALCCLKYQKLVPSLNFQTPNEHINFDDSPFYVNTGLVDWRTGPGTPRRAAVSSFGFSGTNCHLVVEEPPRQTDQRENVVKPCYLILISAKTEEALERKLADLTVWLEEQEENYTLGEIAYTLSVGRSHFQVRLALVVNNLGILKERVREISHGNLPPAAFRNFGEKREKTDPALKELGKRLIRELSNPENAAGNDYQDKLLALADLYCKGYELDWKSVLQAREYRRISLPTYPFAQEKYWFPLSKEARSISGNEEGAWTKKIHPFLDCNISTLTEQKFAVRFTGNEFYLTDHVVNGVKILPGVAYLEMARAAGKIAGEKTVRRLKNIVWTRPIVVAENPLEVWIVLTPNRDAVDYQVVSNQADQRLIYAQGQLIYENNGGGHEFEPEIVDLEMLKRRSAKIFSGVECYGLFQRSGFRYGPRFQALKELYVFQNEAFSRLEIPEELKDGFSEYILHPTLMDGALQTVMGLGLDGKRESALPRLPFTIGEVEIFDDLSGEVYTHLVEAGDESTGGPGLKKYQIRIMDPRGKVLVRINDFTMKEINPQMFVQSQPEQPLEQGHPELSTTIYCRRMWQSTGFGQGNLDAGEVLSGGLLLFDLNENFRKAFAGILANRKGSTIPLILVRPGKGFRELRNLTYEIKPASFEDYRKLIGSLEKQRILPDKIISTWSQEEIPSDEQSIREQLQKSVYSLIYLTQALMESKPADAIKLLYLHRYRKDGAGENPVYAAVNGLIKTIRLEDSKFGYKTVALESGDWPSGQNDKDRNLAGLLLEEFQIEGEQEIRYFHGERYLSCLEELNLSRISNRPASIKEKGVYLITGGLGGLGLIFADYLARQVKARLVLAGRSSLDAAKRTALAELSSLGAEVTYIQADLGQRSEVEKLYREIKTRYSELNGIIHCAGINRDAFLHRKTSREIDSVLAPKVFGAFYLDQIMKEENLDFLVLFSSTAAELGNAGQSDYAYANSFLDHFALIGGFNQKRAGRILSINWPLWRDGGMRPDPEYERMAARVFGMTPLAASDGVAAFAQALSSEVEQLIVIEGQPQKVRKLLGLSRGEQLTTERAGRTVSKKGAAPPASDLLSELILADLLKMAAQLARVAGNKIEPDEDLHEYGFDSVTLTAFSNDLNEKYNLEVTPAIFFELNHPSIRSLGEYLLREFPDRLGRFYQERFPAEGELSKMEISESRRHDRSRNRFFQESMAQELLPAPEKVVKGPIPIAIIGMSAVMPQSENPDRFWENLVSEKNLVTEVSKERWDWKDLPEEISNTKWGGFMKEIDKFDAEFFNISPREARMMDPQQRIFLEIVWKTIEDAGYDPSGLAGSNIGLFMGISGSDYHELLLKNPAALDSHASIGLSTSIRANRISFLLDFHGPSEPIDTACSSSLVAIHRGVEAIRSGSCEMAIAGGVNVITSPTLSLIFHEAGMLSPEGRCKTFDRGANGYVRGEGAGAIFLKPLARAEADGDHIYAVLKSSAENHGGRSNSLTAPNANAQAQLLITAYENTQIDPSTISYIETHGTGTNLGDPVEINGLKKAFRELYQKNGLSWPPVSHCGLGSVKTNIGHLEAAAGIASVVKVLLGLKHKQIPATINFQQLNPYIDLADSPFYIISKTQSWNSVQDQWNRPVPRRAGVSSFGYGGSNAHLILEEYQPLRPLEISADNSPRLIVLSARNEARLKAYAEELSLFLEKIVPASYGTFTDQAGSNRDYQSELVKMVAEILRVEAGEIDPEVALSEYGFDQVNLAGLAGQLNARFGLEVSTELLALYPSIHELTRYLNNGSFSDPVSSPSLAEIAYTLQVGRPAMAERLAFVASNVRELWEKIRDFHRGHLREGEFHRGSVPTRSFGSEVSDSEMKTLVLQGQLDKIAALFSTGAKINWLLLYPNGKPTRVSLPSYPFARERHWFDTPVPGKPDLQAAKTLGNAQSTPIKLSLASPDSGYKQESLVTAANNQRLVLKTTTAIQTAAGSPASPSLNPPLAEPEIAMKLREILAGVLYTVPTLIKMEEPFKELGLDSILGVEFVKRLKEEFGVVIKATKLYDYSTIRELAQFLVSLLPGERKAPPEDGRDQAPSEARPVVGKHPPAGHEDLVLRLIEILAGVLYTTPSKIDPAKPFQELGLDSILGVEFVKKLGDEFRTELKATKLYDYATVSELAKYLRSLGVFFTSGSNGGEFPQPALIPEVGPIDFKRAEDGDFQTGTDVAIIGASIRLPGSDRLSSFWDNLKNGVDSITEVPRERWDVTQYYSPDRNSPLKTYSKWGGFLKEIDRFDPLFFNISPAEAEILDPQQRLFLQEAYRALEDAGYAAESLNNLNCGVFAGVMTGSEYPPNLFNAHSILAARVSYFLNLKGPALSIDTACSSSLVALTLACRSLINGETEMMIVGGVTLYLTVKPYLGMCHSGMLSPEGKCKTFDDSADGFVPGEGVGVVILKRLDRALADGDHIYGVVKGSGINQDGKTNGITAPSAQSQKELELSVYRNCGINPESISYVEAHGTGTKLGDPIEIEALTEAFRHYTPKKQYCPIGSLKSNIGHTSAVSGIAGVVKVLLALKHDVIPPSINFRKDNEHINFADSPFFVNKECRDWKRVDFSPRRAAVSSFGYSGTNAHVIIGEPPIFRAIEPRKPAPCYLIPLSAKTGAVLEKKCCELAIWLEEEGREQQLADLAYTLGFGRSHFSYRVALVTGSFTDLKEQLKGGEIGPVSSMVKKINSNAVSPEHRATAARLLNELRDTVGGPPEEYRRKLLNLADLYISGVDIDWEAFYHGYGYRRISAPAYPFIGERYWIKESLNPAIASSVSPIREQTVNLLAGNIRQTTGGFRSEIRLTGQEFFLRDNVVYGQKVLPGVAYLEMARAAAEASGNIKVRKIKDLAWLNLITVADQPRRVMIDLKPTENGADLMISTLGDGGDQVINAQGRLVYHGALEATDDSGPVDLVRVKKRCTSSLKGSNCYEGYQQRKFLIGPSLQAMQTICFNETEALSELELPAQNREGFREYVLHPSLMDAVLQTATGLMINLAAEPIGSPYLSFALGETEILKPLIEKCYVYATLSGRQISGSPVRKFDIQVLDQEGFPLIRMKDFCIKKALQTYRTDSAVSRQETSTVSRTCAVIDRQSLPDLIKRDIAAIVSQILKLNELEIDFEGGLLEYGFTSITAMEFINRLNKKFAINATIESFFDLDNPTISSLAGYLYQSFQEVLFRFYQGNEMNLIPAEISVDTAASAREIEPEFLFERWDYNAAERGFIEKGPVAVIGMGGILPKADHLEAFWSSLENGEDLITEIPEDHRLWQNGFRDRAKIKWAALLEDPDSFDAVFFGIPQGVAKLMDLPQKLFLETLWRAIEDAGYKVSDLSGTKTGIFAGVSGYGYFNAANIKEIETYFEAGNGPSMLANRTAHFLNLCGPSESLDTFVHGSLAAIHRAVEALQSGKCGLAIAGGVNIIQGPSLFSALDKAGMLSKDGRCRAFDHRAGGSARGEGAGAIILKPLHQALADHDHIYAVIKGISENHGGRTESFTCPSLEVQTELIVEAYTKAGIDPETVDYIEAHAVGTLPGDAREINALKLAFDELYRRNGKSGPAMAHCGIGSVKSNIGHLEAAAGIAGVLKVLLAMKHQKLPANLHFDALNPEVELNGSPFYITRESQPWKRGSEDAKKQGPRRAGISSFGYGGSNFHMILEALDQMQSPMAPTGQEPRIFVLSAQNKDRLQLYAKELADFLVKTEVRISKPRAVLKPEALLRKVEEDLLPVATAVFKTNGAGYDPDSVAQFVNRLQEQFKLTIIPSLVFGSPSIGAFLKNLCRDFQTDLINYYSGSEETTVTDFEINPTDLAWTLQAGREEMTERLAVIASGVRDLIEKLNGYYLGKPEINDLFEGRVNGNAGEFLSLLTGEEGTELIRNLIKRRNLAKLAHFWVLGGKIEWNLLYSPPGPYRIPLPTYPFEKRKPVVSPQPGKSTKGKPVSINNDSPDAKGGITENKE